MYRFMKFCQPLLFKPIRSNTDNRKVSTFFTFQHVRCRCCYRSYMDRFLKTKKQIKKNKMGALKRYFIIPGMVVVI